MFRCRYCAVGLVLENVDIAFTAAQSANAIRLANDSEFGLAGGIFNRDPARGERLASESIESGLVFVKAPVESNPALPFGASRKAAMAANSQATPSTNSSTSRQSLSPRTAAARRRKLCTRDKDVDRSREPSRRAKLAGAGAESAQLAD